MFINDTNNLIKKNKKIILNLKQKDSILKNKFWMNVYEKMKNIIYNYSYKNNITYKNQELHNGNSILTHVFKDSSFISPSIIEYIKNNLTHYYLIEFDNNTIYYFVKSTNKSISNKTNKDINEICRIIYTMKILFNRTNKNNKQVLYYFKYRHIYLINIYI